MKIQLSAISLLLVVLLAQEIDSGQKSPIKYVLNTASGSLFDTYFPPLSGPTTWTPLVSDSLPNTRQVSRTITSWNSSPNPLVFEPPSLLSQRKLQTPSQGICSIKVSQYRESLVHFGSNDFNPDSLSPGTILHISKPNDIFAGFQGIYIPSSKRNSYTVRYGNGIALSPATGITDPASFKNITRGKLYTSQTTLNSNVVLDFKNSSETLQAMKSLGLSSADYQSLGLAIRSAGDSSPTAPNRITVTLFQSLFSAAVDFSSVFGGVNPTAFFLNNNFTADDLFAYVRFGYWGLQNGPAFVSQANYGRLAVLTVNETAASLALLDRLKLLTAGPAIDSSAFESALSELFSDRSLLTFVRGFNVVPRQSLRTIMDLNGLFMPITSLSVVEGGDFQPLTVSLVNFSGSRLWQVETRIHSLAACQLISKVVIQVNQVSADVSFRLKKRGQTLYSTFLFTLDRPGSYDVTSMLAIDNEFRVTLRAKRRFSFRHMAPRFYSNVSFSLVVNGKVQTTKELICKRCHTEYRNFDCRINLADGTVSC